MVRLQAMMVDLTLAPCCRVAFERSAAEAPAVHDGSCSASGRTLKIGAVVPHHNPRIILGNFGGGTW